MNIVHVSAVGSVFSWSYSAAIRCHPASMQGGRTVACDALESNQSHILKRDPDPSVHTTQLAIVMTGESLETEV